MQQQVSRWPRLRSLGQLLQSPAHRVVRVLQVTQAHWQLPAHRGARAGGIAPPRRYQFDSN